MKKLLPPTLFLLVGCHPALDSGRYSSDLPISGGCEAPVIEEFPYDEQTISVSSKHCVDKMGPDQDGYYDFYYDYQLFEFSLGTTTLRGRTYEDDPEEAHFLGIEVDGQRRLLSITDFEKPLLRAAIRYFHNSGRTQLNWLDPSNELDGYSPVP